MYYKTNSRASSRKHEYDWYKLRQSGDKLVEGYVIIKCHEQLNVHEKRYDQDNSRIRRLIWFIGSFFLEIIVIILKFLSGGQR